jgi:segregation and condensation protein A
MNEGFSVSTQQFQGPLEVLLNLIQERKLYINELSLAEVTDAYLSYVQSLPAIPLAETSQFVLVASTLLLIKSKSLLPTLDLTNEEEASIEDLSKRLSLYQFFRGVGEKVRGVFARNILFSKDSNRKVLEPVFSPHISITKESIRMAAGRVLESVPTTEPMPKAMVKKVMSLEEMIDTLSVRIQSSIKLSFKEFSGMGKKEKVEVIVGFLAMLELVKQGIINVEQQGRFSDILMETDQVGVPRYG